MKAEMGISEATGTIYTKKHLTNLARWQAGKGNKVTNWFIHISKGTEKAVLVTEYTSGDGFTSQVRTLL